MRYVIEYTQDGKKQYDGSEKSANWTPDSRVDNIQDAYLWSDKKWAIITATREEKGSVIPVRVISQEELNQMEVTIARQLLAITQENKEHAATCLKVIDLVREVFKEKAVGI